MRNLFLALLILPGWAASQSQVVQPGAKSPLRKEVLDALRPAIEKDLKQKVIFQVQTLRVYKGWAFADVHPRRPDGKEIDFRKTKYKELLDQDVFGGETTFALLRLNSKKKWVVREFVIGPTDVAWIAWMEPPYSAPKALFPSFG